MSELLPCPFHEHDEDHPCEVGCYNNDYLDRNKLLISWWVSCEDCGARGPEEITPEEAIKAWNHRRKNYER